MAHYTHGRDPSFSNDNVFTRIMGFSVLASFFEGIVGGGNESRGLNGALTNSLYLFILGTIIESGRRFFKWAVERFKLFQYSITAKFQEGDPTYEWLTLLLTEEKVWTRARHFRVNATNSAQKWTVNISDPDATETPKDANAEYLPTYEEAQLFRWKGYWVEIQRTTSASKFNPSALGPASVLYVTLYTRDMGALSALVDDAKSRYLKKSTPHVIVHTIDRDAISYGLAVWKNSKRMQRRPLSSIILQEGVIQSLVQDTREFLQSEDWYLKAGIPYRRGYLLHGPPGTGKSSTIYAVAGELGLEIYSVSLASGFIDDSFIQLAVAAIPKRAIFLIEDIDCAFPSREDSEDDFIMAMTGQGRKRRAPITLSGLLNILDGIGSEEGKIFFATTNYIDRLDSALLRPGRIDKKVQYRLATKAQAAALFLRFYPESYTTLLSEEILVDSHVSEKAASQDKLAPAENEKILADLSMQFSAHIPEHEFSTAELQGFLLSCKQQPEKAAAEIKAWVEKEKCERAEKQLREDQRRAKIKKMREMKGNLNGSGGLNILDDIPDPGAPHMRTARGDLLVPSMAFPHFPTAPGAVNALLGHMGLVAEMVHRDDSSEEEDSSGSMSPADSA